MPNLTIDEPTQNALSPYGFSEAQLARFAARAATADSNAVQGVLTPPREGDVTALPALGSPARKELAALGERAIARGEVGAVILAGGMATRFGGVVKAVVPVLGDKSFLELKHDDVVTQAERVGATIPCFVMSSFATHERIIEHVGERGLDARASAPIRVFAQLVSLRLTPSGELFRDGSGELSPYATGHGDLSFALRASGVLEAFRAAGGKLLVMSNVDNLGASLDPAILGFHLQHGQAITAEVVPKNPGDKGGAPARLDDVPQIIEGFRFPADFDQDSISVFNTNTFVLDAAAIDRDFDLPFYRVEKQVDGQTAIQFERLVGELTAFLPTRFIEVRREGDDGRFLPAKDPDELARRLPMIEAITKARR